MLHIFTLSLILFRSVGMENGAFVASYHRSSSEEKLVIEGDGDEDGADDDEAEESEELEEVEEEYEFVEISPKHVHFVTDPMLSSWSDSERAFEEESRLG